MQAENEDGSPTPDQPAPKKRGRSKKDAQVNADDADTKEPSSKKTKTAKEPKKINAEDVDVADEPLPKKTKALSKKDKNRKPKDLEVESETEVPAPKMGRGKGKEFKQTDGSAANKNDEGDHEDAPPRSKRPQRKASVQQKIEPDLEDESVEDEPKIKKGRKKAHTDDVKK